MSNFSNNNDDWFVTQMILILIIICTFGYIARAMVIYCLENY